MPGCLHTTLWKEGHSSSSLPSTPPSPAPGSAEAEVRPALGVSASSASSAPLPPPSRLPRMSIPGACGLNSISEYTFQEQHHEILAPPRERSGAHQVQLVPGAQRPLFCGCALSYVDFTLGYMGPCSLQSSVGGGGEEGILPTTPLKFKCTSHRIDLSHKLILGPITTAREERIC